MEMASFNAMRPASASASTAAPTSILKTLCMGNGRSPFQVQIWPLSRFIRPKPSTPGAARLAMARTSASSAFTSITGVREAVIMLDLPHPETAKAATPASRPRLGRLAPGGLCEEQRDMAEASLATPGSATPVIILNAPQLAENIGAVARVMANFGLSELRLVNPRDGWPQERAWASASGADWPLDDAQLFTSVEDAIADLQRVYATTARPRELQLPILTPRVAAAKLAQAVADGEKVGLCSGRSGPGWRPPTSRSARRW